MQLPIPTPSSSSINDTTNSPFTNTNPAPPNLTSTTAPGKYFTTRTELQNHYKSDWHRYNLKRREAGLPMLNEVDFTLRLEAAVALRKEREGRAERSGVDHRKDKSESKKGKKKKKEQGKGNRRKPAFANRGDQGDDLNNVVNVEEEEENVDNSSAMQAEAVDNNTNESTTMEEEEEEPPEINPSQSIFDNHTSPTPAQNLTYLQNTHSFYLPDAEYCVDIEGFLGYCNEKVRWGNLCLYCQKPFGDTESVLKHMRDKRHCKVAYVRGVDMEEFDVFYDFSGHYLNEDGKYQAMETTVEEDGDDEEEWEDVDDDEDGMEVDDDDLYSAYQSNIASQGFDITPLGELIFPDGRIIGHRALARYYKQRFAPDRTER
ncbi:hypothetical protein ACHAXR_001537, partial [Thalassiosira sp. AJA248-18]